VHETCVETTLSPRLNGLHIIQVSRKVQSQNQEGMNVCNASEGLSSSLPSSSQDKKADMLQPTSLEKFPGRDATTMLSGGFHGTRKCAADNMSTQVDPEQPYDFYDVIDLKCESPKQDQPPPPLSPRRKRLPGLRGIEEYTKEMTIKDLRSYQPRRSSLIRRRTTRNSSLEYLSQSTGAIRDSSSSLFPQSTSIFRKPLSAGANDLGSWRTCGNSAGGRRRRRRSEILLQGVSSSLRSLPRELAIENDEAEEKLVISPGNKQDIVDKSIDAIIDEFAEEYLPAPAPPMLFETNEKPILW